MNPEVVITPSPAQYEQLARDLETLLGAGSESHTAAILEAVREKAAKVEPMRLRRAA